MKEQYGSGNAVIDFFKRNGGILIALGVIILVWSVSPSTSRAFLQTKNILNVLRQISTNVLLACGMTMVIILAGIDLSVGAVIALSGCISAGCVLFYDLPVAVAMLAGMTVGIVFGAFNGVLVCKTTIPPFIITLATMNIARGLSKVYTGGKPLSIASDEWKIIGAGYTAGIPNPVWIMLAVLIVSFVLLNKTKFGRHLYAVGGNINAARFSGINVEKIQFIVYTFSGLLAGIAGIITASRMYTGSPNAGESAEMDAIAAVVVGGTSMSGGTGTIGGTFIGCLIIGFLNNGLNLMNVDSFWQYVIKGVVILLAVLTDFLRSKRQIRLKTEKPKNNSDPTQLNGNF